MLNYRAKKVIKWDKDTRNRWGDRYSAALDCLQSSAQEHRGGKAHLLFPGELPSQSPVQNSLVTEGRGVNNSSLLTLDEAPFIRGWTGMCVTWGWDIVACFMTGGFYFKVIDCAANPFTQHNKQDEVKALIPRRTPGSAATNPL